MCFFAVSFTQRHPTTFRSQLFCAWKCQGTVQVAIHHKDAAWRWRAWDNHWCLKGFCLLTPKPTVSKVWWDFLINSKLKCSVTLFPFLLGGDAVFFPPLGAVDLVRWWKMSDLCISHSRHLHLFTALSQGHCPSLAFLPVSLGRLGLWYGIRG